jgi:DNA-binding NarL/FixJ family response regulator
MADDLPTMSTAPAPIRLLLVDDHSVVRMGLAAILGLERDLVIVAEAEDAESAASAFREHRPDVTLMDARMPGGDGIEAVRRIRAEFPEARILMLTTFDLDEFVFGALDAGASGYLLKSVERNELVAAIREVHRGGRCMPADLEARLLERGDRKQLSPRELEVLDYLRRGLSNRDIAVALGISENTAKSHVKAIFAKLEAADRAEAVATAFERGLLHAGG